MLFDGTNKSETPRRSCRKKGKKGHLYNESYSDHSSRQDASAETGRSDWQRQAGRHKVENTFDRGKDSILIRSKSQQLFFEQVLKT